MNADQELQRILDSNHRDETGPVALARSVGRAAAGGAVWRALLEGRLEAKEPAWHRALLWTDMEARGLEEFFRRWAAGVTRWEWQRPRPDSPAPLDQLLGRWLELGGKAASERWLEKLERWPEPGCGQLAHQLIRLGHLDALPSSSVDTVAAAYLGSWFDVPDGLYPGLAADRWYAALRRAASAQRDLPLDRLRPALEHAEEEEAASLLAASHDWPSIAWGLERFGQGLRPFLQARARPWLQLERWRLRSEPGRFAVLFGLGRLGPLGEELDPLIYSCFEGHSGDESEMRRILEGLPMARREALFLRWIDQESELPWRFLATCQTPLVKAAVLDHVASRPAARDFELSERSWIVQGLLELLSPAELFEAARRQSIGQVFFVAAVVESQDSGSAEVLRSLREHPEARVRELAAWGLRRLVPGPEVDALQRLAKLWMKSSGVESYRAYQELIAAVEAAAGRGTREAVTAAVAAAALELRPGDASMLLQEFRRFKGLDAELGESLAQLTAEHLIAGLTLDHPHMLSFAGWAAPRAAQSTRGEAEIRRLLADAESSREDAVNILRRALGEPVSWPFEEAAEEAASGDPAEAFWSIADALGSSVEWGGWFGCVVRPEGGAFRGLGDAFDQDDRYDFTPDQRSGAGPAEARLGELMLRVGEVDESFLPLGEGAHVCMAGDPPEARRLYRESSILAASRRLATRAAGFEGPGRVVPLDEAKIEAALRRLEPLGIEIFQTDFLLTTCVFDVGLFFHAASGACSGFLWYVNDQ